MEVLHLRVRVLFLPHALVPRHLHALLRILFFSRPVGERFCQCSVAVDGVSLIGSSDELECLLAREGVLVDPNEWAVVRVCEGQSGFESVGVIERNHRAARRRGGARAVRQHVLHMSGTRQRSETCPT